MPIDRQIEQVFANRGTALEGGSTAVPMAAVADVPPPAVAAITQQVIETTPCALVARCYYPLAGTSGAAAKGGPTLLPALLRTIHLGYLTMTLERKAVEIGQLLGATKSEMGKMDKVLETLAKQANTFTNTIESARVRTRAVDRKLRSIEAADPIESARLLGTDDPGIEEEAEGG